MTRSPKDGRPAAPQPGDVIDPGGDSLPFYLAWVLGAGRYGMVFRAVRADYALCAIKVVPWAAGPQEAAAQWLYPYTLDNMGRPHPNLVHLFNAFRVDEHFLLVMELCDGSLNGVLAEPGYNPHEQLLPIARDVLNGLGQIHHVGAIHNDFHGGNVLYVEDEGVRTFKISDLGQRLRWVEKDGSAHPEMLRIDIHAAAALLAEVALGGRIYSGLEDAIAGLPPLVFDALRDGLHDGYPGEDAAKEFLTTLEFACVVSGW